MHAALGNRYKKTEPTNFFEMDVNHKDTCVETPEPQQKDITTTTFVLTNEGYKISGDMKTYFSR